MKNLHHVEISDALFSLSEARQSLLQSRTRIHSFNIDYVEEEINKGKAALGNAEKIGLAALDEFNFRKMGLGVSTLILTILVFSLWLKIKEIDKKHKY